MVVCDVCGMACYSDVLRRAHFGNVSFRGHFWCLDKLGLGSGRPSGQVPLQAVCSPPSSESLDRRASGPRTPRVVGSQPTPKGTPGRLPPAHGSQGPSRPSRASSEPASDRPAVTEVQAEFANLSPLGRRRRARWPLGASPRGSAVKGSFEDGQRTSGSASFEHPAGRWPPAALALDGSVLEPASGDHGSAPAPSRGMVASRTGSLAARDHTAAGAELVGL
jgi:hypothetical protein